MSPALPCICQSRQTANLSVLTVLLLQGREDQRYYRAHTASSHLQDGLAGYLQEHQQSTSGSYPPGTSWSYTYERAEQRDHHPGCLSDPVTKESLFHLARPLSEHRGYCCAGIPKQLLICSPTPLRRVKYSCYQANTEHRCWTSQIGSGSFSYKRLKNSSTFPKPNSTHYSNTDMIVLLQFCSEHLKHVHNEKSDLGLDLDEELRPVSPIFLLFDTYWYTRSTFHKTEHTWYENI